MPVIIDGHGAINDLVAAIAIDVSDAELVIAIAAEPFVARRGAVEHPALGQRTTAPIPRREYGAPVIAARHNDARVNAIKIGDAGEEAVGAVGVGVAPDGLALLGRGIIRVVWTTV